VLVAVHVVVVLVVAREVVVLRFLGVHLNIFKVAVRYEVRVVVGYEYVVVYKFGQVCGKVHANTLVEHLARHVVAVHEYVVNGVVESVERVVVVVAVVGTYAYSRYCHFGFVIRVGVVLVAAVYLDSVGGRSVGHLDKAAVYCGHGFPVVVAADGEPCGVVVREAVLRAVNNEPVVWHAYFEKDNDARILSRW
jgi:hypothetical protein